MNKHEESLHLIRWTTFRKTEVRILPASGRFFVIVLTHEGRDLRGDLDTVVVLDEAFVALKKKGNKSRTYDHLL